MKKIKYLLLVMLIALTVTGCKVAKSKAYIYKVSTGDKIKVEIKTNGGYDLTSEVPIDFKKDGEVISSASFATAESYDSYYNEVKKNKDAKIIEDKETKNLKYFYYKYKNKDIEETEYNYIIKIKNSDTCFIIGSIKGDKEAKDIFKRLTITKE